CFPPFRLANTSIIYSQHSDAAARQRLCNLTEGTIFFKTRKRKVLIAGLLSRTSDGHRNREGRLACLRDQKSNRQCEALSLNSDFFGCERGARRGGVVDLRFLQLRGKDRLEGGYKAGILLAHRSEILQRHSQRGDPTLSIHPRDHVCYCQGDAVAIERNGRR